MKYRPSYYTRGYDPALTLVLVVLLALLVVALFMVATGH